MGGIILATTKMSGIVDVRPGRIAVEPGVTIAAMQERLREAGAWFPPAPTFTGAFAGGIVATNAAGAATYKYGTTRDWVEALTVVLADGTVLELDEAPDTPATGASKWKQPGAASRFRSQPIGCHRLRNVRRDIMPRLEWTSSISSSDPKGSSASSPGSRSGRCRRHRMRCSPGSLARRSCRASRSSRSCAMPRWRRGNPAGAEGIDAAAIEHIDRRSLEMVREDGAGSRNNVSIPERARLALLVQLEL